jgi:four helix bundle protein
MPGGYMKNFRDVKAWSKSHAICLRIYAELKGFPREELYGLINQMRRSAASIPTNIAEGCGRNSDAELARFFDIAKGSANELAYQLILSKDLGYLNTQTFEKLDQDLDEVQKMLAAFILRIRSD